MSRPKKPSAKVGCPIRFKYEGRFIAGVIARIDRHLAFILGEDRRSYRVPLSRLEPPAPPLASESASPESRPAEEPFRGPMPSPDSLHPGDRVAFVCRGQRLSGRIARLNPKRARVVCGNDEEYAVPYALLSLEGAARNRTDSARSPEELAAVIRLAEELLAEHRLGGWSFDFDHAVRRAGSCHYGRRRITLSLQFARQVSEAEIRETLLHEIAHALVGPEHHHDAVWRARAKEIGASGERCHDRRFSPPRYIVQCRNGCWSATAERRRRNIVCRRCQGEILYQTYTEQRWQQLQSSTSS